MVDLLAAALRDRPRRLRRETADLRDRIFLRLFRRGAFIPTAAPPEVSAVVRYEFRRNLRLPRRLLRPRFSARVAFTACMTPPYFFTLRCQADSVRRFRRPLRVFDPGFSVASHIVRSPLSMIEICDG
jgi:hypothetical protein